MRTMETGMRIRDTVRAVAVIMLLTITQTTSAQQTDPAPDSSGDRSDFYFEVAF